MKLSCLAAVLIAIAGPLSFAQAPADQDHERMALSGTLELVDTLPGARVEGISVSIHQRNGHHEMFRALPDRDGRFTLENVLPDHYSLEVHFPGRIQVFTLGSKSLVPSDFEITAGETGSFLIAVSMKGSALSVTVVGLPENHSSIRVVAWGTDPYLTQNGYGTSRTLPSGNQTRFPYLTPGRYTLFVIDPEFQMALTNSAVRDGLRDKATAVQVQEDGETKTTAHYISSDEVRRAVSSASRVAPKR